MTLKIEMAAEITVCHFKWMIYHLTSLSFQK